MNAPRITTANQVSSVYGIASAGNKVFVAQIVASGPIAITTMIKAIARISLITSVIFNLQFRFQIVQGFEFFDLGFKGLLGAAPIYRATLVVDFPVMIPAVALATEGLAATHLHRIVTDWVLFGPNVLTGCV
jgi:hypothetical protein